MGARARAVGEMTGRCTCAKRQPMGVVKVAGAGLHAPWTVTKRAPCKRKKKRTPLSRFLLAIFWAQCPMAGTYLPFAAHRQR